MKAGEDYPFSYLPEDMQVLIFDLVECYGTDNQLAGLTDHVFTLREIPVSSLVDPQPTDPGDERGSEYVDAMVGLDLPPIVVYRNNWVDGRHRVLAARKAGTQTIQAIDLAELGKMDLDGVGFGDITESKSSLYQKIFKLRSRFAEAAQDVYDEWEQDEDGDDFEHGTGGICSDITFAIMGILGRFDIDCLEAGQDGDDHSWVLAYDDTEAYEIDIPYSIYEFGGGYQWTKKPGVQFKADDLVIWQVDRKYVEPEEHFYNPPKIQESRARRILNSVSEDRETVELPGRDRIRVNEVPVLNRFRREESRVISVSRNPGSRRSLNRDLASDLARISDDPYWQNILGHEQDLDSPVMIRWLVELDSLDSFFWVGMFSIHMEMAECLGLNYDNCIAGSVGQPFYVDHNHKFVENHPNLEAAVAKAKAVE